MLKLLLDRGDASWILALDDIGDLRWEGETLFSDDFPVLDDVDGDVVVDKAQHVKVYQV